MDHETDSRPATVAAIDLRQVPRWPDDLPTMAKYIFEHMTAMREEGLARTAPLPRVRRLDPPPTPRPTSLSLAALLSILAAGLAYCSWNRSPARQLKSPGA